MTPVARIIRHPLTWCLLALVVLSMGIIVLWNVNRLRLSQTLREVEVIGDRVRVAGITISEPELERHHRGTRGRWYFWAPGKGDDPYLPGVACIWNSMVERHGSWIPIDLESMYHQSVELMRLTTGREPIFYRWINREGLPRHSAVWQLPGTFIEIEVSLEASHETLLIAISPASFRLEEQTGYKAGGPTIDNDVRSILRK